MTTDELRERYAKAWTNPKTGVVSDIGAVFDDAITELEARDREIAELRERSKPPFVTHKVYEKMRERAENAESMNVSISVCANHTAEIVSDEVGCWVCEAQEANERAEKAEAEVKEYAFLFELARKRTSEAIAKAEAMIQAIEIYHDYGCECGACRAIAEYRKVAPEATITQEET